MIDYVYCTSYRYDGICTHQAAPRRLFGPARCIVMQEYLMSAEDPRRGSIDCRLCTPHPTPEWPPAKPEGIQPASVEVQP